MASVLYPAARSSGWPARAWLWRGALAAFLLAGGALAVADANADWLGVQIDPGLSPSKHESPRARAYPTTPSRVSQADASEPGADQTSGQSHVSAPASRTGLVQLDASTDAGDGQADAADDTSDQAADALASMLQDSERRVSLIRSWAGQGSVGSGPGGLGAGGASASGGGSQASGGAAASPKTPTDSGPQLQQPKLAALVASAAPEPQTWTMLLVGFGVAGVALRRRRRHPA